MNEQHPSRPWIVRTKFSGALQELIDEFHVCMGLLVLHLQGIIPEDARHCASTCLTWPDMLLRMAAASAGLRSVLFTQCYSALAYYCHILMICRWLMAKYMVAYFRLPSYNLVRICLTIVIALLYGTFFYKKAHVPAEGEHGTFQSLTSSMRPMTSQECGRMHPQKRHLVTACAQTNPECTDALARHQLAQR